MTKTNEVSETEKFTLAMKKQLNEIPRSKRPNGATQKRHQPKKFSSLIIQEATKTNWDKKMAIKRELKKNQQLQTAIKEQAKALNPPKPKSTAQAVKKVEPKKVTKASLRKEKRLKKKKAKAQKKKENKPKK